MSEAMHSPPVIRATSTQAVSDTTDAGTSTAIPLNAQGEKPTHIMLSFEAPTATCIWYAITQNSGTLVAEAADNLNRNSYIILDVRGYTHVLHKIRSGDDGVVYTTPLENG